MLSRTLLSVLAVSVALAGCGSDSSGDASAPATAAAGATASTPATTAEAATPQAGATIDTTPTSKSKSDGNAPGWAKNVNALCTENRNKITKLSTQIAQDGKTPANEQAAKVIQGSQAIEEDLVKQLRAADVPGDVRRSYDDFVDSIASVVDLFPQLVEAAKSSKPDPDLSNKLAKIGKATQGFASKYGLTDCASG